MGSGLKNVGGRVLDRRDVWPKGKSSFMGIPVVDVRRGRWSVAARPERRISRLGALGSTEPSSRKLEAVSDGRPPSCQLSLLDIVSEDCRVGIRMTGMSQRPMGAGAGGSATRKGRTSGKPRTSSSANRSTGSSWSSPAITGTSGAALVGTGA
jgi:hypothetical protein